MLFVCRLRLFAGPCVQWHIDTALGLRVVFVSLSPRDALGLSCKTLYKANSSGLF